jgi:hypothetical protein
MQLNKILPHQNIYFWASLLLTAGLSLGNFLISLAFISLACNWILEGGLSEKFKAFTRNKAALTVFSIYLMHLIGLLYTSDFDYASNDLKTKLPLLGLPIIFSSIPKMNTKQFKWLLGVFIGAVFVGTLVSYGALLEVIPTPAKKTESDGMRNISILISHIRFSLLICMAIFTLGYLIVKHNRWRGLMYAGLIIWFVVFLFVLQSATGFSVLVVGSVVLFFVGIFKQKSLKLKLAFLIVSISIGLSATLYVKYCVDDYFEVKQTDAENLPEFTAYGEKYRHHPEVKQLENGHYLYLYIAYQELEDSWNERSRMNYKGKDRKGQPLYGTILRYMTSKGLHKDRDGVAQLTEQDIRNIESGKTSIDKGRNRIRKRIDQIIFELDHYINRDGDPSGNSVTQRLEYWRSSVKIINMHPVVGVGTGDVQVAFDDYYERSGSKLDQEYRFRAHNQLLTILVTFGILGFIWFLFFLIYPVWLMRHRLDFFFFIFYVIALLSFLAEDTLETQVGVSFFAFFYCLLLFGLEKKPEQMISESKA